MLTPRGWNLLIGDLALVGAGVGFRITSLALVGLTVLLWFLATWCVFTRRVANPPPWDATCV